MKLTKNKMHRCYELDVLRGFAIVLMVIFHFCYDLSTFGWASYNTGQDLEWRIFRAIIVTSFLLAVGMSSYLAYHKHINLRKLTMATAKLLFVALILTIGSLFMYPSAWVYFGIIHLIAVALPISVLFVRLPYLSLIIGVLIILSYYLGWLSMEPIWSWSVKHLGIPKTTVDLASIIPWLGVVLIGVFVMHKQLFSIRLPENTVFNKLSTLGQYSLIIYLLHQPILYAVLLAVKSL
ncbi:heparan-alpha-glucosaminide N-acetyltransferase [Paraglaciecola marina]|uniref:heparan-alpha-glucosaminide N-acetyltransferase n=1 Tax=Paraglaciecola marina TaxID=2500157 RepID=UPI00105B2E6D|nr:heparan-alpha-glucosaminide N-acetyltransferase [Paraglaciecola marina]